MTHFLKKYFMIIMAVSCIALPVRADYDDDDFDIDDDEIERWDLGEEPIRRSCTFSDQIVQPLNECGVVKILKNDLYCKTTPIPQRSILDLPALDAHRSPNTEVGLSVHLFGNGTHHKLFGKRSGRIDAHLGFTKDDFVSSIENFFHSVKTQDCGTFFIDTLGIQRKVFDLDIRRLAFLLGSISLWEHRIGTLISYLTHKGNLSFEVKTSLHYFERNFFLDNSSIEGLKKYDFFPESSPDVALQFAQDHLIADKFGLGDTRLTIGYHGLERDNDKLVVGAFATIPTAIGQKGILGSSFKRECTQPTFDLCDVLNLGLSAAALNMRLERDLTMLGHEFIDRLSAMTLDEGLGRNGHWGFGLFIQPSFDIAPHWRCENHLSIEYITPKDEHRFFIKKNNAQDFDKRNFNSTDQKISEDNLRFLNARLLDIFFPQAFPISVRPGAIFQWNSAAVYNSDRWHFHIGSDYWYQAPEHIHTTNVPLIFNTKKAKLGSASQLKFFGGVGHTFKTTAADWRLSLNNDTTVLSTRMGNDVSIGLQLEVTW